jgi:phosphoglycolate phosphatase
MKYRLAIFDLDGTLADSLPWFLRIANTVADKHGFRRIETHEIESLRGKGSREIVRHFQVPMWRMPLIARDVRRMKAASLDGISLFAGVDGMLESLSAKGVVRAMVSSDSEDNVRRSLGTHARAISHFACGASLFGKAAKFRRVVRRAGIPPARAIAIGDEVRDIEAARAAGVACGAVTWGYAAAETLRALEPDLMFERMEDIAPGLLPPA